MTTIDACLFDMGNVLVFFSHDRMCQNVADLCNISVEHVQKILLKDGLQWKIERGEITEDEFHQAIQLKCDTTIDKTELLQAVADIFWLNDSIVPLIDELKHLGIRLVLLSNTSVTHLNFIRKNFDILDRFDDFATSYEAGALKPDQAIYELALKKAGCPAANCFYTDDIEEYVLKARTLGINAEVYSTTQTIRSSLKALGMIDR